VDEVQRPTQEQQQVLEVLEAVVPPMEVLGLIVLLLVLLGKATMVVHQ
jgi:hypothetical protein